MNRVHDLQGMEEVHQMLKEWKKELNEPSPSPSLQQVWHIAIVYFRSLFFECYWI